MLENISKNASGTKVLITSIISQAVTDAVCCSTPEKLMNIKQEYLNSIPGLKGAKPFRRECLNQSEAKVLQEIEAKLINVTIALDARRFLKTTTKLFNIYCNLVDIDPEWAEKKIWGYIAKEDCRDKSTERFIKKIFKKSESYEIII